MCSFSDHLAGIRETIKQLWPRNVRYQRSFGESNKNIILDSMVSAERRTLWWDHLTRRCCECCEWYGQSRLFILQTIPNITIYDVRMRKMQPNRTSPPTSASSCRVWSFCQCPSDLDQWLVEGVHWIGRSLHNEGLPKSKIEFMKSPHWIQLRTNTLHYARFSIGLIDSR